MDALSRCSLPWQPSRSAASHFGVPGPPTSPCRLSSRVRSRPSSHESRKPSKRSLKTRESRNCGYAWATSTKQISSSLLALESYQKALSLDGTRPKAWYRVAKIKMIMGDRVGAMAAAQRVVELAPDFAPVRWRLGLWQLEGGHLEQAQASFERAIALDAGDPAGWWGLARVLLQEQLPEQAAVKSRVVCKSEGKLLDASSVRLPWRPPWARGVRGPGNGARSRPQ